MPEQESGFLYLMVEDSRRLIKIGISKNPPKREQQLNTTKIPYKVRLFKQIQTPHYKKAERILHKMYHKQRIDGEWFALEPEEVTCLMLLTPEHIDSLCRRTVPAKSLIDVIEGSREIFLNPSESFDQKESKRKDELIESLKGLVDNLKSEKEDLSKELTRTKLQASIEENPTADLVRSALRSLATTGIPQVENSNLNHEK